MKKITLLMAAMTASVMSFAAPEITKGTYTIGTADGNDFKSLAEAFTAVNAATLTGDVTLQVTSDLAEPKNVGIQNKSEFTITLTVDKAEPHTISFSQSGDNAGPSGNICIGCDMTLTHTCASVETKNIVIDGSFNSSEERYLTIKSVAGCHKLNGPILVYGNVKNTTIKNCNLIAENGVGSSLYPVTIRSQKGTDYAPENIVVDGNHIEAITGVADQGVYFQLTTAGKIKPANITISNNEIIARTRGIYMNGAKNVNITNNTIKVQQTNYGMLSYGIWGMNNMEGTITIQNNQLQELTTGAKAYNVDSKTGKRSLTGIIGIETCGGADWVIRNNYIGGFNLTAETADSITVVGIKGAKWANSMIIEHNTIALADQKCVVTNAPVSAGNVCLMTSACANSTIKNNLLVSNETDFANALISPAGIVESNVYCTKSYVGTTEETKDFAAYKTAAETTAKSVEAVEFKDLANGILDLAGASDGDKNLGVAKLADVEEDIYGTERGDITYAGAFEGKALPTDPTALDEMKMDVTVEKVVRNGQVLIIRDGKTYNMMGQIVE